MTTTISTKGQVILPKEIRDLLHWDAGTQLTVEHTTEGVLLKPFKPIFPPTRLEDVIGCAGYTGPTRSLEEMDAAITEEVRRRHERGRY